jgi:hypothetical protein
VGQTFSGEGGQHGLASVLVLSNGTAAQSSTLAKSAIEHGTGRVGSTEPERGLKLASLSQPHRVKIFVTIAGNGEE